MNESNQLIVQTQAPQAAQPQLTGDRAAAAMLIDFLTEQIGTEPIQAEQWEDLRELLAAQLVSAAEHALAINNIENARRYVKQDELGAARYELRFLARRLRSGSAEQR